jgi:hypothetical protein
VGNSNGNLTLSQREKRGIESLAVYLEERGGRSISCTVCCRIMSFQHKNSSSHNNKLRRPKSKRSLSMQGHTETWGEIRYALLLCREQTIQNHGGHSSIPQLK